MRLVLTLGRLAAVLGLALYAAGVGAQSSTEELQRQVAALQEELARLKAAGNADSRLAELERRIDLLAAEIEKDRTGGATAEPSQEGARGLAPAASKVYGVARGVSIGGYGEALYENYSQETQSGQPSGRTDQVDFVRAIVYVGYKFSDKLLFNSETEFEHASTGKGGEVSVEFAYLDYAFGPKVGLRAGMLLVPVGFLNELHEPPIFHGARRPEVETVVLPSTWRENGAGLFGQAGGLQWRAYAVAGLNSAGFTAAGLRGGRQSGARSKAEDFAFVARADWSRGGLLAGASFYTGDSAQGATVDGQPFEARLQLFDLHAQYEWRGLLLRGLYARSTLGDAAAVNRKNGLTGSKSVGEAQAGWYVQAAFDVFSLVPRGQWSLTPFVRYERIDTQDGVPAGYAEDPATDRELVTAGLGLKPLPQVVLKADYQWHTNQARSGVNQFNLAVGYLF